MIKNNKFQMHTYQKTNSQKFLSSSVYADEICSFHKIFSRFCLDLKFVDNIHLYMRCRCASFQFFLQGFTISLRIRFAPNIFPSYHALFFAVSKDCAACCGSKMARLKSQLQGYQPRIHLGTILAQRLYKLAKQSDQE